MKITKITGYHLEITPHQPLGNARTFIRNRQILLLEIQGEHGMSGWGEVFSSPWAAAALIRNHFAPMLRNQSVLHYGAIYQQLTSTIGYDRRGPAMMAISAIDMALHDCAARAHGVRVADMLGGAVREQLPAYASGPFIVEGDDPYRDYLQETEHLLEQGFRAIKPRAGASPRADGEMVFKLRELVGPNVDLMVDINQGYTRAAACDSAAAMDGAGLLWVEEPVPAEDFAGYRAVSKATTTAIAGGEAIGSLPSFQEFLSQSNVSLLQPDITVCGGYTGFRRVAALAEAFNTPVLPHSFGTAINFFSSLQLAATLPTYRGGGFAPYPFVEYDATDNPLIKLFGFPIDSDGFVSLPDGPGIGVNLRPDQFGACLKEHWHLDLE